MFIAFKIYLRIIRLLLALYAVEFISFSRPFNKRSCRSLSSCIMKQIFFSFVPSITDARQRRISYDLKDAYRLDMIRFHEVSGYMLKEKSLRKRQHFIQSCSPKPAMEWIPGALSPEVKRPRREADHLLPASAEVNKTWICTSTPSYAVMA
jgi:hypothetical protein